MFEHGDAIGLVLLVFLVAGLTKGIVGAGLPLVSMGLLALAMEPAKAAALMVIPAIATNLFQGLSGGNLLRLARRFWPMLVFSGAITLVLAGSMSQAPALASMALGFALAIYGIYGLARSTLEPRPLPERWMTPVVGVVTGVVTAFTGVFSVPSVPYFHALGLKRDELVQMMGISFFISAATLAANLGLSSGWNTVTPALAATALGAALTGVWLGSRIRNRVDENTFRKLFLVALVIIGAALVVKGLG